MGPRYSLLGRGLAVRPVSDDLPCEPCDVEPELDVGEPDPWLELPLERGVELVSELPSSERRV